MPQHQLKLRALEWSQRWTEPCFKRSLPGILSQWCTQCWRSAQKGQVPRLMRPQVTLSESVRFSKAIMEMWHPALEAGSVLGQLAGASRLVFFQGLTAGRCLVDGCFRHCAGPQQILSCGRYCQQPRIRVLVLIVRLEFSQIVQTPNILGSDDLTCIGSSFRWTCCALSKPQPEVESHAIPEVESLDQSLHAFGLASALPMRDTDGAVQTWDVQKIRRWAPFYIEMGREWWLTMGWNGMFPANFQTVPQVREGCCGAGRSVLRRTSTTFLWKELVLDSNY